jgi:tripartite-type tricarboxylate transporter receptor subunit TctC
VGAGLPGLIAACGGLVALARPPSSSARRLREVGTEFEALPWWALFAPKGIAQPVLDRLTKALDKALDDDSVRKRLFDIGGEIPAKAKRGQQPLAALVKSEIARWTPIIKAAM